MGNIVDTDGARGDRGAAHELIGALQHGESFDSQRYAFFGQPDGSNTTILGELGGLDDEDERDGTGAEISFDGEGFGEDEVEITMDEENDDNEQQDMSLASMFMGLMNSKSTEQQQEKQLQRPPQIQQSMPNKAPNLPDLPMPALLHKMPVQRPLVTQTEMSSRPDLQNTPFPTLLAQQSQNVRYSGPAQPLQMQQVATENIYGRGDVQSSYASERSSGSLDSSSMMRADQLEMMLMRGGQQIQSQPHIQPQLVPVSMPMPMPMPVPMPVPVPQTGTNDDGGSGHLKTFPMPAQPNPIDFRNIPTPPSHIPQSESNPAIISQDRPMSWKAQASNVPSLHEVQLEQQKQQQIEREQKEHLARELEQRRPTVKRYQNNNSDQAYDNRQQFVRQNRNHQQQHNIHIRPRPVHSHQNRHSRTRPSVWMDADEIDRITRIQYMTTHSENPYRDDYYYLAAKHKEMDTSNVEDIAKLNFSPSIVRELLPTEKGTNRDPVEFLKIEGLGVFARSNLKGPKPLLDVSSGDSTVEKNQADVLIADDDGEHRALADEPMLAARCLIEDGECLLLDIDDVERMIKDRMYMDMLVPSGSEPSFIEPFLHRRLMLIDALAASLRIKSPEGDSMKESIRDGVFRRVTLLPKGISLFARFLRRLKPGDEAVNKLWHTDDVIMGIVLTAMRNVSHLYSTNDDRKCEAASDLSITISEYVKFLQIGAVEELAETDGDLTDMLEAEEELPIFKERKGIITSTGLSNILLALLDSMALYDSAICKSFGEGIKTALKLSLERMKVEADSDKLAPNAKFQYEKVMEACK